MAGIADIIQGLLAQEQEQPQPQGMMPVIPKVNFARPVTLPPDQEQQFQSGVQSTPWYQEFVKDYGEKPNLDDTAYNYRRAWTSGIRPDERNKVDQKYHWSDATSSGETLKSPYHATAWMGPFMQQYGVNPDDLSPNDPKVVAYKQAWQQKYPPANGNPDVQGGS